MIRHCVFIRFKPTISAAAKSEIFDEVAALKGRIAGLLAVHVGTNVSPETGMDNGFIVDFDDSFARDAYLVDAEHQKVGAKIVAAALDGANGVLVYDLETDD